MRVCGALSSRPCTAFAAALQRAAAFVAAERRPSSLGLVTLDDRLAIAARKEGFEVVDVAPVD